MTQNEIKQIERVYQKSISEIKKEEIPSYIRKRDEVEQVREVNHNARRNRLDKEREEDEKWAERAEIDAQREKEN